MKRKTVLTTVFLSITGVAVGWEITAAVIPGDNLEPWTSLIADYIPPQVAWAGVALLNSWLPGHLVHAYQQRGKTMDTTIVPATPEAGSQKEPLITPTTVTSLASALVACLVVFGLPLTNDQTIALLGFVTVAAPIIVGVWARRSRSVFAAATVRTMVVDAAATGEIRTEAAAVTVPTPPVLPDPGDTPVVPGMDTPGRFYTRER